jgi:hypothetical protein
LRVCRVEGGHAGSLRYRLISRVLFFSTVCFYATLIVLFIGVVELGIVFPRELFPNCLVTLALWLIVFPIIFGACSATEGSLEEVRRDRAVYFSIHPVGRLIRSRRSAPRVVSTHSDASSEE